MKLILASASPRRKELLAKTGLAFDIIPAKGEETITKTIPAEVVMELSQQKAREIAKQQTEDCIIIGADTIVAKGDTIMGKPKDAADARRMLEMISDDCHQVYTGVTIIRTGNAAEAITFAEKTDVYLYPISEKDIRDYIESGDPMDKAGAYGIQGDFAIHVKGIAGDYYNVVGLPIGRVYQELKKLL
ncbi:MAG: septum formation protein Maf [Anaerotignum sp.]|nr:septum formation protein Maf [Anaerotignum sp.]MBR3993365.1 septum formation protein Maf [Anaerotignum sp.]MBR4113836.1 septum formation protein Maf [Anaerotignum sp.]MBR6652098.1 septum formation protein Maf [Anaerotignum sp.]